MLTDDWTTEGMAAARTEIFRCRYGRPPWMIVYLFLPIMWGLSITFVVGVLHFGMQMPKDLPFGPFKLPGFVLTHFLLPVVNLGSLMIVFVAIADFVAPRHVVITGMVVSAPRYILSWKLTEFSLSGAELQVFQSQGFERVTICHATDPRKIELTNLNVRQEDLQRLIAVFRSNGLKVRDHWYNRIVG